MFSNSDRIIVTVAVEEHMRMCKGQFIVSSVIEEERLLRDCANKFIRHRIVNESGYVNLLGELEMVNEKLYTTAMMRVCSQNFVRQHKRRCKQNGHHIPEIQCSLCNKEYMHMRA